MKFFKYKFSTLFLKVIFVLSISIIFFIGAITYRHLSVLQHTSEKLGLCFKINLELERLTTHLKDAESGQQAFIISKEQKFLQPYFASEKAIKKSLIVLDSLTSDSQKQRNELFLIKNLIKLRQEYLQKSIETIKSSTYDYNQLIDNLTNGNNVMKLLNQKIDKMIAQENHTLVARHHEYDALMNTAPFLIYLILLITLMLISIAFIRVNTNSSKLQIINNELSTAVEANKLSEVVGSFSNWQIDLQSKKHFYSDNLYRMLGVEPQSFVACQDEFLKFIHPDDLAFVNSQTVDLETIGILPTFIYRIIRKDNQIRYFRVRGEISNNKFHKKTLFATTIDVTDEIFASKYIEQRNKELEISNKELSAFNYIASHDLQEPLRKIETFLSRFQEKEFDNLSLKGRAYIERIQSSTNRMRTLIDDLLQFSRSSKTEKVFVTEDLNLLFNNAKSAMTQKIEETDITILCENLPTLTVIPFQIQQLFTNLISNAIKYKKPNQKSTIKVKVEIKYPNSDSKQPNKDLKYYKIIFSDDGLGFEQEYAEKIFVLFSRLHNKDEFEGSGIGLAICKKIIENHHGVIYADGIPNEGATFSMYLPA